MGSHTPTSGGLAKAALPYADAAGAEVVQVYVSNSRGWALPAGDPAQDALFRDGCAERGVPVFIHASLLVNLGSPTAATVERSAQTLAHALRRGAAIGAAGVVFHAGSSVDDGHAEAAMRQVRESLLPLLDEAAAAGGPMLLVEPSAGGGRSLASRVEHLGPYLDAVDRHPWLGVCFDTCHAWAAGHDLAAEGGMTATLDTLVATVGAGPAAAGARQRLEGPVRLHPGPAREHRQGHDRRAGLRGADGPPGHRRRPGRWWRPRREQARRPRRRHRHPHPPPPLTPASTAGLPPDLGQRSRVDLVSRRIRRKPA